MTALVTCPRAERVSAVPTARPHRPPWRSLPALPELWTAGPAEPRGLRPGGQAPFQWDVPLSSRDVARGGAGTRRLGAQHPPATPWNRRALPWPHFCFSWKSLKQALGLARSIRKPCVQRTDSAEPRASARLSPGPRAVPGSSPSHQRQGRSSETHPRGRPPASPRRAPRAAAPSGRAGSPGPPG